MPDIFAEKTGAAIIKTRGYLNFSLFIHTLSSWLVCWMYGAAVVILILKVTGYSAFLPFKYIFLTSLPVLFGPWFVIRKDCFSNNDAAAWLDLKGQAGGRVMAIELTPETTILMPESRVNLPKIGLTLIPVMKKLLFPGIFLMASCIVPQAIWEPAASPAAIRHRAARVEKRIESARNFGVLKEEEAIELEDIARRLAEEAQRAPEAAAEGVDNLQRMLEKKIIEDALKHLGSMEAASSMTAEDFASQMSDPEAVKDALKAALEAFSGKDLPEELKEALKNLNGMDLNQLMNMSGASLQGLDPATLKALAEALKGCNLKGLNACGKCAGLMTDKEAMKRLAMLMKNVKKLSDIKNFCYACNGICSGNCPGRGGVDRGRADADLSFGDETDTSGSRFKPLLMEPGAEFLPGVTISKKKVTPTLITPEEFKTIERTGVGVEGRVTGEMTGVPLGPYRKKVAARYFAETAESNQ